jgi:copper homeostasis protein
MKEETSKKIILEICANSVASAIAAREGGADRVELCDNLWEGGTTPSYATIFKARELLQIDVYPIIRPRGGDFLYTDLEFELMKKDILLCKEAGCDGVVIGILTADGKTDVKRTQQLVSLAWPMGVTFHRAFDMTADPFEALEDIIQAGCERILTSGQKNTAPEGAALISQLITKADDRIIIMAGAGVREHNIADLVRQTKAVEYHTTAQKIIPTKMKFHSPITMGDNRNAYESKVTDADLVKKIRAVAESISV